MATEIATKLVNPIGMIAGAGLGLAQALTQKSGKDNMMRIREKEVNQALNQNIANREAIQAQSPEANRLAAANSLQQGRSAAMGQVANIAGGQIANSGLGGAVNSGAIAAAKAAPVAAAGAQYDQAMAGTYGQMAQEQAQQNQQLQQNTMDRGRLAEMTAYINKENSPANTWLPLLMGGGAQGAGLYRSLFKDQEVSTT